jgi:Transglycosylase-like domain
MNLEDVISKPRLIVLTIITAAVMFVAGMVTANLADAASSGGVGTGGQTASASGTNADTAANSGRRSNAKYTRIYKDFKVKDRRWARSTARCESGGDPHAIGGGGTYRGAFQFMRSTWKRSPRSPGGDPVAYPYRTQAVVAVLLMHRDGAGHWPVCG